jgi:hypothetical protein
MQVKRLIELLERCNKPESEVEFYSNVDGDILMIDVDDVAIVETELDVVG